MPGVVIRSRHFVYRNVRNIGDRPWDKGGVSMLAENIGVNVALVDVEVLRKSCAKTCGIKYCTRTDYAALGNSGILVKGICQYVDRITYYYIYSIRRILYYFRNYALW